LVHLNAATAVFILGSTEPHYTPSKVYQAVLSQKPILAVLHTQSTAASLIHIAKAGLVITFDGAEDIERISDTVAPIFSDFLNFMNGFNPNQIDQSVFDNYSAKSVTGKLADLLNKVS
jgi:hypothetical protein